MPMIDTKCGKCGTESEIFRHTSEIDSLPNCEQCNEPTFRVYNYQRPHSYSGLSESVVVYRNPDGSIGVLANRNGRIPDGSERVDLRTASDVRRIEREMTQQEYLKFVTKQEREEKTFGEYRRAQRSELRDKMKQFSEKGRSFARLAMKMNDQAPSQKFQSAVVFDAFSNNAGNRDSYRGDDHRLGRK